jgi:hypothetical protein
MIGKSIVQQNWEVSTSIWRIMRQCRTSRKVVGSIPDVVTGFFNLPNPPNRTMTLESTQPLTEMSTRNLPEGTGWLPARKADNFTAICEPIVQKMWEPRRLAIIWASTSCYRDSFTVVTSSMINEVIL